jgi:putative colanic acid biosynthesis glycosyltransferase
MLYNYIVKKILFLNTTFYSGGAAKIARTLFNNINNDKLSSFYAYGRGNKTHDKNTFYFGSKFSSFSHLGLTLLSGLDGYGSYFKTKQLIEYIENNKFDLIHIHNLHGYYLNIFNFVTYINRLKIPKIFTFHDEWPLTCFPACSMGCEHCLTGKGKCTNTYCHPKTYNKFVYNYMLEKKQATFSKLKNTTIICPSRWMENQINKTLMKHIPKSVISNGIDISIFRPQNKFSLRKKYSLPQNKTIVLFSASKLSNNAKGFKYILKLCEIFKDDSILFLGIGKTIKQSRPNLKYVGFVEDDKILSEYYALSDIFCFPSVAENCPLSLLEAMASGLTCIAFNIPPVKEIIENEAGILTETNDLAELANAIKMLMTNRSKFKQYSKNARLKIETNYSQSDFIGKHLDLYSKHL